MTSSLCSGKCEAGYYCPAGSTSSRQAVCGGAEYYCPAGSSAPQSVPSGAYSTPEAGPEYRRTGYELCAGDKVCRDGKRYARLEWTDSFCSATSTATTTSVAENSNNAFIHQVTMKDNSDTPQAITFEIVAVESGSSGCSITSSDIDLSSSTGALRLAGQIDYEECASFSVQVRGRVSATVQSTPCTIAIAVLNENERPTLSTAVPELKVEEKSAVGTTIGTPLVATDPDAGQELKYSITSGNSANLFKIGSCSGQLLVNDNSMLAGTYTLGIQVADDFSPPLSDSLVVEVVVTNVNDAPRIMEDRETVAFTIDENSPKGTPLSPSILSAVDEDGDDLTWGFTASGNERGAYAIDPDSGIISVADPTYLNFERPGDWPRVIEIKVSDSLGLEDRITVPVTIRDANDDPVVVNAAMAVDELSADGTSVGTVEATDEDSGLAGELVYSIVSDPSGFFRIDSNSGEIFVSAAGGGLLDHEDQDSYSLTVEVSDKAPGSSAVQATVTVAIRDVNEAPVLGDVSVGVDEEILGVTVVNSVSATDPDGDNVFFSLTGGDVSLFTIDATSGKIQALGSLDFETSQSHSLTVTGTDNGSPPLTATCTVTISVNDNNEPPKVNPGQIFSVNELTTSADGTIGTVAITDPDGAGSAGDFSFTIDNDDKEPGLLAINDNGELSVAAGKSPDYERNSILQPTITVFDNVGGFNSSATISVQVLDVSESPEIVVGQKLSVPQNSPAGSSLGAVLAADEDAGDVLSYKFMDGGSEVDTISFPSPSITFALNSTTGEVTVVGSPTTTHDAYTATVLVRDVDGNTDSTTVSLAVADTNSRPTFVTPLPTCYVEENSPVGSQVCTFSCNDLDISNGEDQTLTMSIDFVEPATLSPPFSLTPSATSAKVMTASAIDYESLKQIVGSDPVEYTVHLACRDDGPGLLGAVATLTVEVLDVNDPPEIVNTTRPGIQRFYVTENNPAGASLDPGFAVEDPDLDIITWSLAATTANGLSHPFSIDAASGIVSVDSSLDFEDRARYEVEVTATDPEGASSTITMEVEVENVNEAPSATDASATIPEDAAVGTSVVTIEATDEDYNQVLSYTITSGNDDGVFMMAGPDIRLAKAVDFETKDSYTLAIEVSDGAASTSATATVTISNVNDAVIASISASDHKTDGGDAVCLVGSDFAPRRAGATPPAVGATYVNHLGTVYTAQECALDLSTPDDKVCCKTVAGVGSDLRWTMTLDGATVVASADGLATRYATPTINSVYATVSVDEFSTEGADEVFLSGTNLGPADMAVIVKYGPATGVEYTAIDCKVSSAHSTVRCLTAPGVGAGLKWSIEVAGQRSSNVEAGSYASPSINSVTTLTPLLSTAGGDAVMIEGSNFGPLGTVVDAFYGPVSGSSIESRYSVSCTHTVAHKSLTCTAAPGIGKDHLWKLRLAGQTSDPSVDSTSYRAPVIASISGPGSRNADTAGQQEVLITGENFGPEQSAATDLALVPSVTYGPSATEIVAVACRVTTANVQITCKTNVGTGTGHSWKLMLDGQSSNTLVADTGYHPPVIAMYSGDGAVDALTRGGEDVLIDGRNFGPVGTVISTATYGVEGGEFSASDCEVVIAHERIRCNTTEGAGVGLKWFLTIDGQTSVTPTTAYAAPEITGFSGPGVADASTAGGDSVTLHGTNFATEEFLDSVTYGPSGTEFRPQVCTVLNHETISCTTAAGVGRGLRWIATVRGQQSSPSVATTSYALPLVSTSNVKGTNTAVGLSTKGGDKIRVQGTNFAVGALGVNVTVRVNNFGVDEPDAQTLSDFFSTQESGIPPRGDVARFVDRLTPVPITNGGGEYLGNDEYAIDFEMPAGYGTDAAVVLVVDGYISTFGRVSYGTPEITNVAPDRQDVDPGYLRVFVEGKNFCASTQCGRVVVNGVEQAAQEYSHDKILFVMEDPADPTTPLVLTIEVGDQVSDPAEFRKPVPNFNALQGQGDWSEVPTTGGIEFFIGGVRDIVATPPEDITIRIGPNECTGVTKRNFDSVEKTYDIYCTAPPGFGTTNDVLITTKLGGTSRASQLNVAYAPPSISDVQLPTGESLLAIPAVRRLERGTATSIVPREFGVPTSGGRIVLKGSGFGDASLNGIDGMVRVIMENKGALAVDPSSHTDDSVEVVIPPGDGLGWVLSIQVGDQSSQSGVQQTVIRYEAPVVSGVTPQRGPTSGGTIIRVFGSNLGVSPDPEVTVGGSTCPLDPTWSPSEFTADIEHIRCVLPEGVGASRSVDVRVGGQLSTVPGSYSYAAPVVMGVFPNHGPTSGRTADGEPIVVTLVGANFGTSPTVALVGGIDNNGLPVGDISVPPANIVSFNHTVIRFQLPEGTGAAFKIRVVAGEQSSLAAPTPLEQIRFDYDPPSIAGVRRADRTPAQCEPQIRCYNYQPYAGASIVQECRSEPADCFPTAGGYMIEVFGLSFGPSGARVRIGGALCDDSNIDDTFTNGHSAIFCRAPRGLGDNIPVTVETADGRISAPSPAATLSYDPPIITQLMPNTPNALGQQVEVRGKNFGFQEFPVTIVIGSKECLDAEWVNDGSLRCTMQADTVGPKNISVLAANRTSPYLFEVWQEKVVTQCVAGDYGLRGETCLNCADHARGASCPGGEQFEDLIVAEPGFWRYNVSADDENCHVDRRNTRVNETCPHFVACEPSWACEGSNVCAVGYEGVRCEQCAKGTHYRINGECKKCPDSPWLIVIFFIIGALVACLAGYVLNSREVNIAFLSIGVDYFQVLAMFARARVHWPAVLIEMFNILSAFNLNLELAAPECAIPEVSYAMKWFFSMALPLAAAVIFGLVYVIQYCYKRFVLKKPAAERHAHVDRLISIGVVIMYFLYIYLTRLTLDVFNCSPTDPPDGKEYMSGMTDVECFVSPVHQLLLPFAFVSAIVYVAGYPLFAVLLLRSNRLLVKTDQILRARGAQSTQDKRMLPEVAKFRMRWHRLYYLFKPGKWYWIFCILMRKFLIVFTALMFRSTPIYQMATALLVMFAAYALQVRHNPYMSPGDHEAVLADHQLRSSFPVKAGAEPSMHHKIAALMDEHDAKHAKGLAMRRAATWRAAAETKFRAEASSGQLDASILASFLIDYNTVEAVLLGCSVLVCLSGIMFLSDRYSGDLLQYYQREYDGLAITVATLMVASIVYFVFVLVLEILAKLNPQAAAKLTACCNKRGTKEAQKAKVREDLVDGAASASGGAAKSKSGKGASDFHLEMNTYMGAAAQRGENLEMDGRIKAADLKHALPHEESARNELWAAVRQHYQSLEDENTALSAEVKRLKVQEARAGSASPSGRYRGVGARALARNRTDRRRYNPVKAGAEDSPAQMENPLHAGGDRRGRMSKLSRNRTASFRRRQASLAVAASVDDGESAPLAQSAAAEAEAVNEQLGDAVDAVVEEP